jgi:hypothetical protein
VALLISASLRDFRVHINSRESQAACTCLIP